MKIKATKIKNSTQYQTPGMRPAQVDKYHDGKRVVLPAFDPILLKDLPKIIAFLSHIHEQEGQT